MDYYMDNKLREHDSAKAKFWFWYTVAFVGSFVAIMVVW